MGALLLMKSVLVSIKPPRFVCTVSYDGCVILLCSVLSVTFSYVVECCFSFFMVMLDFLLLICQRKRLKGIYLSLETLFCFGENSSEGFELYPCLFVVSDHNTCFGCGIAAYLTLMRILTFQELEALQ